MKLNYRMVHLLAVLLFAPVMAIAQAPAECPPTAEQAMFNTVQGVKAGAVTDGSQVYGLALQALEHCADRSEVQAMAAELLAQVASTMSEDADRFVVLSQAYAAAVNNHNAFSHGASPKVKLADGSEHTLYPYTTAGKYMSNLIAPELLTLAIKGQVHPIFNDEPLTACPYQEGQGRLRDEVQGLRSRGANFYHEGGAKLAIDRIYRLKAVCTEQTSFILLKLAKLHTASAEGALEARQLDFAVDHAQKAHNLYNEFLTTDVTDPEDRLQSSELQKLLRESEARLAKAIAARDTAQ